jgi:hypothetical protein
MPPRKAAPPPPVKTKGQLAQVYGCSVKHIDDCIGRGAPDKGPKGFDLMAWGAWWADQGRFRRLGGQAPPGAGQDDPENWRRRKDRAEALLAENKLRSQMGIYARRDDVDRAAARDLTTLRLILETVPDRVAALVPREQSDAVLDAVADTVATILATLRTALARWSQRDDPEPLHDVLHAGHRALERMPTQLAKCVRGARQKERLRVAARMAAQEIRETLAAAVAGEHAKGDAA